ncbi:MAG: hypothetical protein HYR88_09880, partial [Verrucomicrobia bacterium]|nr:hypothetical protein [Verrucomicrobiota bacterium]
GKAIYQVEVLHINVPSDIENDEIWNEIFLSLRSVWSDYHQTFGNNNPLKRYQMGAKDWDINFEGVAHYGLLPDFLQDLTNVGLETSDMSPLFQSADNFADMWVKTLRASHEVSHPVIRFGRTENNLYDHLNLSWAGQEDDVLEQTDNMSANPVWVPAKTIAATVAFGEVQVIVNIAHNVPHRYFRVRKHD